MDFLRIIGTIVIIIVDLILVLVVLLQTGRSSGLGAIAGGAEQFLGKSKARGMDAKLLKYTKIAAAVFIVLSIGLVLLQTLSATAA